MRQLGNTDLKRLHREWRRRTHGRLALLLDGVQSPFNVGAIIRTAAALRVEHVWFAGGGTTPANSRIDKTAMGTARLLQWSEADDAATAVRSARDAGWTCIALELTDTARPLHDLDLSAAAVCLVVGHEDRGVSPGALDACDLAAYLPLVGRVGSLNVATAASMACYEVRRQEWATAPDA